MRRFLSIQFLLVIYMCSLSAQVGINTAMPDASAALDVTATDKGLLIPRVALASAIASPAAGLMVHQTSAPVGFYYYNGTAWTLIGPADNLGNHTATQNLAMGSNSITGANNITATGTATLGGNTYPTTTGTNGQVLQTNGAGQLSWGSSSGGGASLQLSVTHTTAVTTSIGSSLTLPDILNFESANASPAALTGGNTWTGTNKFTVGSTGAGLYFIDIQIISGAAVGTIAIPMIDMNNTGNSASSFYGVGTGFSQTAQAPNKFRGQLQKMVYLNAGDNFQVRILPSSNALGTDPSTNGSTYLRIAKLN